MGRDFDGTAFDSGQFDAELGGLVSIAPRGHTSAQDAIGNFGTRNGEDDLFVISHHLSAV